MDPFLGEIRMFAGNFAPQQWAFCNGQLMQIAENAALFELLGTTYGGDGQRTFALPDLRGRVPVHFGSSPIGGGVYAQGERGGAESVAIVPGELPAHSHAANGGAAGNVVSPANAFWSSDPNGNTAAYTNAANSAMSPNAIGVPGAAQAHDNMQPFLGMNYIIALNGIFPSRG